MQLQRKVRLVVVGQVTGRGFTLTLEFKLCPPKEGSPYYGNGYYMTVRFPDGNVSSMDCRYAANLDIIALSNEFIISRWGPHVQEIIDLGI